MQFWFGSNQTANVHRLIVLGKTQTGNAQICQIGRAIYLPCQIFDIFNPDRHKNTKFDLKNNVSYTQNISFFPKRHIRVCDKAIMLAEAEESQIGIFIFALHCAMSPQKKLNPLGKMDRIT